MAETPLLRARGLQPVDGFTRCRRFGGASECLTQSALLLGSHGVWLRRDEQRRLAPREEVEPHALPIPPRSPSDRSTAGVHGVEGTVLSHPIGESVDAHLSRPLPLATRRIATRLLQIEQARSQVSDGIAAHDERLAASF